MKSRAVEADIGRGVLRGNVSGDGDDVVCLLSTLAGTWLEQARGLRGRYTVLTYDMRGYGRSTSTEPGFPRSEAHAEDLARLLDQLGFRKVILVGLSHGGTIAQYFALAFPELLRGLVITSSFAKAWGPTAIFLRLLHGFLQRGDLETFWEVLKSFLCSERNLPRILAREDHLKRLMFDQYTCESLDAIYTAALEHDTRDRLPAVTVPTLVVGGLEDMLFPPAITQELASLVPGARLAMLETAHVPPVEAPDAFRAVLIDFLGGLSR